jgi:hypothetical protein
VETKSLTYEELAQALGIAPASAKRLAIRRKWTKQRGNDGRTRVSVPIEKLEAERPVTGDSHGDVTGDITDDVPGDVTNAVTGDKVDITMVLATLNRLADRLERELEVTKSKLEATERERDAERARMADLTLQVAQVDVLREVLEAEKRRSEELR